MEVRTYADGDAPRVLELLQSAFGAWPGPRVLAHDRPADFFRWKHETNPHGASFIVLAEEDERLIGMRAYMHWPLRANGAPTGAVQAVDLATHPDFRGKGVNSHLTRHAIGILRETKSFAFGLPNDMSRSQSRKVGWRPVGRLPVWVRVCRPLAVARGVRSMRGPAAGDAVGVDAAPAAEVLAGTEVLAGAESGAVGRGRLSGAAANRYSTDADPAYLRWRYQPFLGDYRAVTHGDGLAIFRLTQRGRLNEATVCELIAPDRATAARLLSAIAQAAPFDYLALGQPLSRAGVTRSPIGGRLLGVTPYRDHVEPDPTKKGAWALSLGDLERLELC